MTPEELQKVMDWLKEHYVRCPNCRAKGADAAELLGLPMNDQPKPEVMVTAVVVPVTCKKCGHMSLFNVKPIFGPPAK